TVDRMPDIHCPVLVVHSSEDDIVPYEQGRKLYAAANEPRYFLEIQGDHNHGFLQSGNAYMNGLRKFLDKYMPMTDYHESSLTD
ncbi:MAG TPA: alpha/beta hydrolase, partial [Gammaproteobacteria bacterium]|nr:alpha/beta hydrolase [Gammaproteobacteria bacterium]